MFKVIRASPCGRANSIDKICSIFDRCAPGSRREPESENRKKPCELFPLFFLCYNQEYQTMKGEPTMAKDKDKGKEKSIKPKLSIKDKKKKKKEKLERKLAGL